VSLRLYRWLIVIAWLIVFAITVFDIRWAIRYHETALLWESNPVMRWVMWKFGVWTAGATRLFTILFAASLMPLAPRRCQVTATLTLLWVHIYLAATYAIIIWEPEPVMAG
jgi:hypothetical protein